MPTPWIARVWAEFHAGNLTRAARDVLLTLHTFRAHGGAAWPSHATLASRARCCTRTVQRALQEAQRLCLVDWAERRVRAGWRWLQSSNLYRFLMPDGPVEKAARPIPATSPLTDFGTAERRVSNKEDAHDDRRSMGQGPIPNLLAARRAAWEAGLVGIGRSVAMAR